jgi:ParB family chromosome partitioning protein
MKIFPLPLDQLTIPIDRQRKEFSPEEVVSLATSISSIGIIHPLTVRKTDGGYTLVAGERRLKALHYMWNMGEVVRMGQEIFKENFIPAVDQGALSETEAYEIELSENIQRVDLSWQDKAIATSKFQELKRLQAERAGLAPPSHVEIGPELRPESNHKSAVETARKELILARHLGDEDVAAAPSLDAAYKVVKRKEELRESARLGISVGRTFSAADHALRKEDCIDWMKQQDAGQFDVILTDPPYGMNAQDFGDSGGKANGAHFYDDTPQAWRILMLSFATQSFILTKPQAHAYVFCDIEMFPTLREIMASAGWECFRTPLIWVNPTANRAPWPEHGPHRKWQAILYAIKGKKMVNRLAPDVLEFRSDVNLNHQAQKPVALYQELLARSCKPGDSVLDPFCGTGPIFPAAHALKVKATGIELDDAAYGIAVKRLGELK